MLAVGFLQENSRILIKVIMNLKIMAVSTFTLLTSFLLSVMLVKTCSGRHINSLTEGSSHQLSHSPKSRTPDVIRQSVSHNPEEDKTQETSPLYRMSTPATADRIELSSSTSDSASTKTQLENSLPEHRISKRDISQRQLMAVLKSLHVRHYRMFLKKITKFNSPMFVG